MRRDDRHAALTQMLMTSVRTLPGAITLQLRTQVETYVVQLNGSSTEDAGELPLDLYQYINKVALHAYKVTDEDIFALLKAGYSEDAIFEITVSAALGAGMMRLRQGLGALRGEMDAS